MAKRARGTTRPGQRPPIQRSARPAGAQPAAVAAPVVPADPGLAPTTGLDVSLAPAGVPATGRSPDAVKSGPAEAVGPSRRASAPSGVLAAEAAVEYRYVSRDIRRIAVIGGSMFAILIILFILLEVVGLGH